MAAGNEDHSFFFFEMLQGYVIVYINCAQMEPLSSLGVAPPLVCVAWHAKVVLGVGAPPTRPGTL